MITPDFVAALRSAPVNDDDLKASLLGGWNPHLPAIQDERGTLLVGNRRMAIAKANDITPVIATVHFGDGPEADEERARLAVVSNVGSAGITPADRKRVAAMMYGQGMTQEAIAQVMGVSRPTIGRDLETLLTVSKVPDRVDRLGRVNTGRPKSSTPKALPAPKPRTLANPEAVEREQVVGALRKQGLSTPEIAAETGLHERNVAQALEHVQIADEAHARGFAEGLEQATLDPAKFYKSVQEQAARMQRQYARDVETEVRRRFLADITEHYDTVLLPKLKEREARAANVLARRKGVLTRGDYELIRSCLHADQSMSSERIRRAFDLWTDKKDEILIVEQERTQVEALSDFPSTREELLARKQQVKDARSANLKAKREAKRQTA